MDAGTIRFERRTTRRIEVGGVPIGDGAPISRTELVDARCMGAMNLYPRPGSVST